LDQEAKTPILEQYPIQIRFLAVQELWIKTFVPPDISQPFSAESVVIGNAHGPFSAENKAIQVTLSAQLGNDLDPSKISEHLSAGGPPFAMRVVLVCEFQFDDTKFPMDKVNQWADQNAPLILFPYLREHVFSLTSRCGYKPLILPLIQVPTLKVDKTA
jgi:hypothetical protein